MSSDPNAADEPLTAVGERVLVRPPTPADETAYVEAVTRSSRRLADFAMPDPHNLPAVLASQSPVYRTFMVIAREPAGEHGLVGRINVANVVRGAFLSATIGYDAYDPYAGRGLFVEGLTLALDLVFADEPTGMALHRVEANIQPANARSAGLVRSLGFVHEGFSRAFLHLPGDRRPPGLARPRPLHDARLRLARGALPTARAPPGGLHRHGSCGLRRHDAGSRPRRRARGAALLRQRPCPRPATLFELLRSSPVGGVVECRASGPELRMGLARAGFDPSVVPVLDTAVDVPKAEVVRRALAVRAAFA